MSRYDSGDTAIILYTQIKSAAFRIVKAGL